MESQPLSPVQICQQGLTHFAKSTSKTQTLGQVLRIFYKTIRFFSLLKEKEDGFKFHKCSLQIKGSMEILGVVQGVHLIEEFLCPDSQGQYFLQRASLQKCAGRGFLFGYNFLSNLKLIEKLELASLPDIARIAIGGASLLRLATVISYLFYRLLKLSDGIRTGRLWQVAVSVAKIFTVTSTLILSVSNAEAPLFVLALTSVSILTDMGSLAKTEKWV
jgi:hypothetical protein